MDIKIGGSYVFDTHGDDFQLNIYSGETVEVIRPLVEDECDIEDVGMMYKVRLPNGDIIDAFEDELLAKE